MVPHRLARALSRLHDIVTRSGVTDVLGPLRLHSTRPRPEVHALLQSFAYLSAGQAEFGEPERALLKAMNLDPLIEAAWWANLITAVTRSAMPDDLAAGLIELCARLEVVSGGFPAMAGLIDSLAGPGDVETGSLTLTLAGRSSEQPALNRVADVLQGLSQLWTVAEELTGHRGVLRLVATSPGTTMSLHFDGLDEPLSELRSLLVSISEQTARMPNIPSEQHAALVPEMLPVMDRITRSSRADAARLRTAIESGVRHLLEAGASLPEGPVPPNLRSEPRPARTEISSGSSTRTPPGFASSASVSPAALIPAEPPPPHGFSPEDIGHLADVIAEERRQLQQAEPSRRLWQGVSSPRA